MPRLVKSGLSETEFHELKVSAKASPDTAIIQATTAGPLTNSLSRLFAYSTWQDRVLVAVGLGTAVLSGANQPIQLIVFGRVIDAFNQPEPDEVTATVTRLALIYLAVGAQMFITSLVQTACMTTVAGRQTKRLREAYFEALLKQSISFFDSKDGGALATSVMESTLVIQEGMGEKLALSVQFVAAFFLGLGTALWYAWKLALLLCGVVPLIGIMIAMLVGRIVKANELSTQANIAAGGGATEALGAIRTVLAFGTECRAASVYRDRLGVAEATGIRRWWEQGVLVCLKFKVRH